MCRWIFEKQTCPMVSCNIEVLHDLYSKTVLIQHRTQTHVHFCPTSKTHIKIFFFMQMNNKQIFFLNTNGNSNKFLQSQSY